MPGRPGLLAGRMGPGESSTMVEWEVIAACQVLAFHDLVSTSSLLRQLPRHGNSSMGQRAMGLIRGSKSVNCFATYVFNFAS